MNYRVLEIKKETAPLHSLHIYARSLSETEQSSILCRDSNYAHSVSSSDNDESWVDYQKSGLRLHNI